MDHKFDKTILGSIVPIVAAPRIPMHRFIAFGIALLLAACAGSPKHSADDSSRIVPGPPAAALDYTVPSSAGPDELARLAIQHNPSIRAARERAARLAAMVAQEGAMPDPMLKVGAERMSSADVNGMVEIGQTFPFPGKRRAAARAAEQEAAAAKADIRALELRLIEQVHAAWWDLQLAGETVKLTRESRELLEAVRDVVDARAAADQARQADQIRLSNELSMIDRDLAEAVQLGATARARLNSLLNRPSGASLPATTGVTIPSTATLESLLARAQSQHPEVAAAERRAEAFQHRLRRAELEQYPDFTVGIGGMTALGSTSTAMGRENEEILATIGINIPLWQEPRRAMIREAKAGIAETDAMVAATRSDLRYRIEEAWFSVRTERDIATLFETRLIPDARQAYEVTRTGYSAGTSEFNDVLDTWRLLLTYQLQHARSRAQLGKATATLRAAAGVQ